MFSTNPTPLDLVFWLGRIPVRVIPTFWLMAFLLGRFQEGLDLVFIWMLCVFFSILIHELGHALVAEAFGYESEIVLHHFGGEARFNPGFRLPAYRSLLISLAGPFAQIALAAVLVVVLIGLTVSETQRHEYFDATLTDLLVINIIWPIFNLFPLPSLDGSRLLFLAVGAIRRKPVSPKLEQVVHLVGLALLLGLFVVVSIGDILGP